MKLLQVRRVAPATSGVDVTLPLTFFDLVCFKQPPVHRLFFYSIPGLDSTRFTNLVLPQLSDSLGLTLFHYLPLAGNILWPESSRKPILRYTPGDAVTLSVNESDADFHHLSGNHVREAGACGPLAASLAISHERASVIAVNLTLFPSSGFCVGLSAHHAVVDGKSTTLFMKSWAHICRKLVDGSPEISLPPELTPVFNRTAIEENPEWRGLDTEQLKHWAAVSEIVSAGNPRSSVLLGDRNNISDLVSGTFELTPANIEKLRNIVTKTEHSSPRLSTFVLSTAYVLFHNLRSAVHAPSGDCKTDENRVLLLIPADRRASLKPPLPATYTGNCVGGIAVEVEESEFSDAADGFARIAVKMSEAIKEASKRALRESQDSLRNAMERLSKNRMFGIAGSNRFGVYGLDFGWGTPEKAAIHSGTWSGTISVAESRDGSGGVEVGVVLTKVHMKYFHASFFDGLKSS